jgi:hypothetical protein
VPGNQAFEGGEPGDLQGNQAIVVKSRCLTHSCLSSHADPMKTSYLAVATLGLAFVGVGIVAVKSYEIIRTERINTKFCVPVGAGGF